MEKIIQVFKIPDLRRKILIILGILILFRVLASVPIPGVDPGRLQEFFREMELLGFLNIFTGGGLANLSIVMLGIAPYITATIIMQLLTIIFPKLKKAYYEEGPEGRAKFNRYSRYLTIPIASMQAYGFLNFLTAQGALDPLALSQTLSNVVIITAGTILLMWFGEIISEYKIGNGISLLIFAGIVATLPQTVANAIFNYSPEMIPTYIAFIVLAVVVIAGVVFVNEGQRKVPVSYAKQVRGMKMYGGASSYLPIKVNQAGVIPIIFAISILLFPQFIAQAVSIFSADLSLVLNDFVTRFFGNVFLYSAIYFILVVLFAFFYTSVTFDPKEISKNLQRSGGFIPGIRPGEMTSRMISKVVYRTTFAGAMFLGIIAVLPNITQMITGIEALAIGGAALLIVVAVSLEVLKQIESQLTMREYERIF